MFAFGRKIGKIWSDRMIQRLVLLLLISWHCGGSAQKDAIADTCKDDCNRPYSPEAPCQCNNRCPFYQNCCKDVVSACNVSLSCANQCEKLLPDKQACTECAFYSVGCVTDEEILRFTASIWKLNVYIPREENFEISEEGEKFFKNVSEQVLKLEPFVRIRKFFDSYNQDWRDEESFRVGNKAAEMDFIHNFLTSEIGSKLYRFLKNKSRSGCGSKYHFKKILKQMWTYRFKRRGSSKMRSNGFENVFAGETNDGVGIGLNYWLRVHDLEKAGELKLQSRKDMKNLHQGLYHVRYDWNGNVGVTTLFVGVTPEWEFAVYTLCHLVRPDLRCIITAEDLKGNSYKVTLISRYHYSSVPITTLAVVANVTVLE